MKPARWFVRVWTVDPAEEGPDDEEDIDMPNEKTARVEARKLRRAGLNAAAFERQNIHVPEEIPMFDPPAYLWECDSVQIDEAAVEREWGKGARAR